MHEKSWCAAVERRAYSGPNKYDLDEPLHEDGEDAQIIRSLLTGLAYETMLLSDPFVVIEGGATGADR